MTTKSNRPQSRKVPANALLAGAWYALEQCGILLNDACLLIDQQRYATAVGLAMFAREELGRHVELLTLWGTTSEKHLPTVEDVRKRLGGRGSHVSKQRRGGTTVTLRASTNPYLEQLLRTLARVSSTSEEHRLLRNEIEAYIRMTRMRQPHERHGLRMRSFYVDLLADGTWQRPSTLDATECSNQVADAVTDYRMVRERVVNGLGEGEQEFLGAWLGSHLASKLPEVRKAKND